MTIFQILIKSKKNSWWWQWLLLLLEVLFILPNNVYWIQLLTPIIAAVLCRVQPERGNVKKSIRLFWFFVSTRRTGSASWQTHTLRVVSVKSVTQTRLSRPLEYNRVKPSLTYSNQTFLDFDMKKQQKKTLHIMSKQHPNVYEVY